MLKGTSYNTLVKAAATVGRTIVISGPSGTGKSTLLKRLFKDYPGKFGLCTSHTTRAPRLGEVDGREYHFVTREQFQTLRDKREAFLEWAEFSNNLYGTSIDSVQTVIESNKMCILDIDLQGVHSVKKIGAHLNPCYVFIIPPSFEELEARLTARNSESPESLQLRLATAKYEMNYAKENPGFHNITIVNDDFETAYNQLSSFIFKDQNL